MGSGKTVWLTVIDSSVLTAACTAGAATGCKENHVTQTIGELAVEALTMVWGFVALFGQITLSFMLDVPVYSF